MTRYFFHIRYGDSLVLDPEGAEFPSIDLAREEAVSSAREILAQRVKQGDPLEAESFEITTEDGQVMSTVPFRLTIRLSR
ncbi:DUF6894 family protein [Ensifer sp. 4252]|uniref:DUF6894 family protein n=1 Tax=Ensifer sp. 4252 TaxID=3373915 RepID=UPI003D2639F3